MNIIGLELTLENLKTNFSNIRKDEIRASKDLKGLDS